MKERTLSLSLSLLILSSWERVAILMISLPSSVSPPITSLFLSLSRREKSCKRERESTRKKELEEERRRKKIFVTSAHRRFSEQLIDLMFLFFLSFTPRLNSSLFFILVLFHFHSCFFLFLQKGRVRN